MPILEVLEFDSKDKKFVKIIEQIKSFSDSKLPNYPSNIDCDFNSFIQDNHLDRIRDKDDNYKRIDVEFHILNRVRKELRNKQLWANNCYKYRNPDEDLPTDFEENRKKYYSLLGLSDNIKKLINDWKKELRSGLYGLESSIKDNAHVKIITNKSGDPHIWVEKLPEQKPPENLDLIKNEVFKRWPLTSLLDVVKETDEFVDFIGDFVPSGSRINLENKEIRKRVLLSILGYGTNTGLKSVSNEDVSYKDLQYIKRKLFDADNLRGAIRKISNSLLKIRFKDLWGGSTTSVASDSKHFNAVDQNLMSSYHPRYHSNGVTVYWHVDKSCLCVYSQLTSCKSSEVAAMLEGILKHCTDAIIDKNYVDTNGTSAVGFTFSRLFSAQLMPRFKNIHKQKLYCVNKKDIKRYKNTKSIIAGSIDWDLIERNMDSIVHNACGMLLGTGDIGSIMRKFTKQNDSYEVFKAAHELGKVFQTIFLCKYFSSLELRQEINSALNVVELWNGVNDFIFYGKTGSLRSKDPQELEISMLCLHILQLSMVYINTLMLQEVLVDMNWLPRMTIEDKRAICPLMSEYINPYGIFMIDIDKRLLQINHMTVM